MTILDNAATGSPSYDGRVVLVTGGTGSFGKTVARHLLDRGVRELRILSRDEAKQHQMRVETNDVRLKCHIGDVRDLRSVDHAMAGVELVFHAAALKQVPSCEFFPLEAVRTNVLGSQNVIDSAEKNGVTAVVCLSTDKAVMPINAMGMTKALMEKVVQAAARESNTSTVVSTVRYGNVLYSRGSVLPLFVDKIFAGQPLTITNPEMTRFLMPLSQAVDLVETAFHHAETGDTFVRKAPAATMGDLAAALNGLFGNPVDAIVIGSRHAEKLYETLATAEELTGAEDLGNYWRLRPDARDLNYAEYFDQGVLVKIDEDYHSHNTQRLDVEQIQDVLMALPEVAAALDRWSQRSS